MRYRGYNIVYTIFCDQRVRGPRYRIYECLGFELMKTNYATQCKEPQMPFEKGCHAMQRYVKRQKQRFILFIRKYFRYL